MNFFLTISLLLKLHQLLFLTRVSPSTPGNMHLFYNTYLQNCPVKPGSSFRSVSRGSLSSLVQLFLRRLHRIINLGLLSFLLCTSYIHSSVESFSPQLFHGCCEPFTSLPGEYNFFVFDLLNEL